MATCEPTLLYCSNSLSDVSPNGSVPGNNSVDQATDFRISDRRAVFITSLVSYQISLLNFGVYSEEQLPGGKNQSRYFTFTQADGNYLGTDVANPFFGYDQRFGNGAAGLHALEVWTASMLARITAATIAYLDNSNLLPSKELTPPELFTITTTKLRVNWAQAGSIYGMLTSIQFLSSALALYYARKVVVKDKSMLSTAQVLQRIANDNYGGSLESHKDSLAALGPNYQVIYGTVTRGKINRLCIGPSGEVLPVFPEGWYE